MIRILLEQNLRSFEIYGFVGFIRFRYEFYGCFKESMEFEWFRSFVYEHLILMNGFVFFFLKCERNIRLSFLHLQSLTFYERKTIFRASSKNISVVSKFMALWNL